MNKPDANTLRRGDVWMLDLNPTRGHEQAGIRPVIVVSANELNQSPAGLVVVVPITSRHKGIRSHVRIDPPEAGLDLVSYAKCEDVRSVSTQRLVRRLGAVSESTLSQVEAILRIILGL